MSIPTDPVQAKALFEILTYIESHGGDTPMADVATLFWVFPTLGLVVYHFLFDVLA